MKILYLVDSPYFWESGCWLYRCRIPATEIKKGDDKVQLLSVGEKIPKEWMEFPDVVVYARSYTSDPLPTLKEYKKMGKKIVYEIDDDTWTVNPDNPSKNVAQKQNKQIESMAKEADVVITTNDVLKKKLKKFNKNVVVVPNALDFDKFTRRVGNDEGLRIGFSGAASHWGDLSLIMDVLYELQKKHDFTFVLQGMMGRPIIAEMYNYEMILKMKLQPEKRIYYETALKTYAKLKKLKYIHVPFFPPELYPNVLGQCNLDIGLCPLKDNEFNRSKSCIKFYEYAATGTATLASKVIPYSKEVGYCAKNTYRDWYNKLEKLIVDKKFRNKLLERQWNFVQKNRDIEEVSKLWLKAFQV